MLKQSIFKNHPITVRILLHFIFWLFFMGTIASIYNSIDNHSTWILFLKDLISALIIFYFTSYVIIPKFLVKKKYISSTLALLSLYIIWILFSQLAGKLTLRYLPVNQILENLLEQSKSIGFINWYRYTLLTSYRLDFIYIIGLPLMIKLVFVIINENKSKTNLQLAKMELELINKEMELTLLKYQLNPHFLFNTLNNIYILVKQQDRMASESILNMNNIMRYLLYTSNKPEVSIKDEMVFISNYIDLERLRFDKKAKIEFIQDLDSYRYSIVPIILFPFIENAFKHSITSKSNIFWIKINISAHEGILLLDIRNSCEKNEQNSNYIGGIGIENAKKRLKLNYQESDYTLHTEKIDNIFSARLSLRLEEI